MSGPYRPGYSGATPLTPASQANQPVSFRTDINRKKTKKWVAAKSYSYDGDDWGDDDDEQDEEEAEEIEPVPQVPNVSRAAPTLQQTAANAATPANVAAESPATKQVPAFVRPADIYRRMQEEKNREVNVRPDQTHSQIENDESLAASHNPTFFAPQVPSLNPPSQFSMAESRAPPPLAIPEVGRNAGLQHKSLDVERGSDQTVPKPGSEAQPTNEGSSLHHNPSLGFNSVVHQAFDREDTPKSSSGSVSRSNSEGTSVISPIMSPWKLETDKTPTIAEESTMQSSMHGPPTDLKQGHRRDLSLPDPGNGPNRWPSYTATDSIQTPEVARISTQDSASSLEWDNSESPVSKEYHDSGDATPRPLSAVFSRVEDSRPMPTTTENDSGLSDFDKQQISSSPLEISTKQPYQAPPLISSSVEESPVTEASTQEDMESDRLRKEIMSSFNDGHTSSTAPDQHSQLAESAESKPRARHESTYLPSEYDSYWGEQGIPPTNPLQVKSSMTQEPTDPVENSGTNVNSSANDSAPDSARPQLKKKFSWEADDSDEDVEEVDPVSASSQSIQRHATPADPEAAKRISQPISEEDSTQDHSQSSDLPDMQPAVDEHSSVPENMTLEQEALVTLDRSVGEAAESPQFHPQIQEPEPEIPVLHEINENTALGSSHLPSQVNEATLPTFRKIMEISSPTEKIKVFNKTREQFAAIESGLTDWIRRSCEILPEHSDLIQANGRLPGGAPTSGLPPRTKFPKLSSFGNLSLPSGSSHGHDLSSSGPSSSHTRRPSGQPSTGGIHRSNVEAKGKEFLHSAGALGGKAGGAARGLFAKGKNKLRGSDKGMSSIFRAHRRSTSALSTDPETVSSDLDFEYPRKVDRPSVSSQYSLQNVPRIPSLRLGDGPSFRDSLEREGGFALHPRSFSVDFSRNLKSLTEQETITFEPETINVHSHNIPRSNRGTADDNAIGKSFLPQDGVSGTAALDSNNAAGERDLKRTDSHTLSTDVESIQNSIPGRGTEASLKSEERIFQNATINDSGSHSGLSAGIDSPSQLSIQKIESPFSVSSKLPSTSKEEASLYGSDAFRLGDTGNSSSPKRVMPEIVRKPAVNQTRNVADSTREIVPTAPSVQDTNLNLPEGKNRRDSIMSQVSAMSREEMDRIREKFDEDGVYVGAEPSPTRSQISDLTDDKESDSVDGVIREKLDEAGFHEDPEKDAWETFPRPPTAVPSDQPIRVVKMSRFSIDKKTMAATSTAEEETKRHSRFSFEGQGNTLAEEMLVNGNRVRTDQVNLPDQDPRLAQSTIPVTMGENAPEEAPPPFTDSEIAFPDDHKETHQTEGESQTPNDDDSNPQDGDLDQSRDVSPPDYPLRSLPSSHIDALWKTGRLPTLHPHRDSIASSSISSMSNSNLNSTASRVAVSPEPPSNGSRSQQRRTYDHAAQNQPNSPRSENMANAERPRWSLWANYGRTQHTRQNSSQGFIQTSPSLPASSPGRREDGSIHSGDSIAVQAAASRQDLRAEPSPLINSSEPDATTDPSNSAKMSTQLLSKMKLMAKRTKGGTTAASASPIENITTEPFEKTKEKKSDGKKKALSRIGGIFNRSGQNQRFEDNVQQSEPVPNERTEWINQSLSSYSSATKNHHVRQTATSSSRHTTISSEAKALPPPPAGYYAPSSHEQYAKRPYAPYNNNDHKSFHQPATNSWTQSQYPYGTTSRPSQAQNDLQKPPQQPVQYQSQMPLSSSSQSTQGSSRQVSNSSPEIEQSRKRAQDLRMRSRSPRPAQVRGVRSGSENVNYSDPIYHMGKFHAVTETPRIGDQSLPFPITLPDSLTNGQLSPQASTQPEAALYFDRSHGKRPTVNRDGMQTQISGWRSDGSTPHQPSIASSMAGNGDQHVENLNSGLSAILQPSASEAVPFPHHPHPHRQIAFSGNSNSGLYETRPVLAKNTIPIELPTPSANDEEEIVMSSTAYPGQEWQPAGFQQWMPY